MIEYFILILILICIYCFRLYKTTLKDIKEAYYEYHFKEFEHNGSISDDRSE